MIIAALSLALVAAPVNQGQAAGQTPPAPAAAQAPAAAPAAPAAAKYSVETTSIETLAGDPAARALVAKHLPGLLEHPSYETFKTATLKTLQPFSQGHITDEVLQALQADLDTLH
jgi:hypothetical protein